MKDIGVHSELLGTAQVRPDTVQIYRLSPTVSDTAGEHL